jgi:hypothetical protein
MKCFICQNEAPLTNFGNKPKYSLRRIDFGTKQYELCEKCFGIVEQFVMNTASEVFEKRYGDEAYPFKPKEEIKG